MASVVKRTFKHGKETHIQGCISRPSLPAGLGALGVSSEHVENMENAEKMDGDVLRFSTEVFSGSPT